MDRRRSLLKGRNMGYEDQYLTVDMLADGNVVFTMQENLLATDIESVSYSLDGGRNWVTTQNDNTEVTITIAVEAGDKILFKGVGNGYYGGRTSSYGYFTSLPSCNVSGNIMSMLYGDNFKGQDTIVGDYAFYYFFYDAGIVSAENLVLPAMTLSYGCYNGMFYYCEYMVTAPSILPAMTLTEYCYGCMFYACYSLEETPMLPALGYASNCYYEMFYYCESLNHVKVMLDYATSSATYYWLYDVAQNGTFECLNPLTWGYRTSSGYYFYGDDSYVPYGWNVVTVDTVSITPELTITPQAYVTVSHNSGSDGCIVGLSNKNQYHTVYISTDHQNWQQMETGVLYEHTGDIYLCGQLTDDITDSWYDRTGFIILPDDWNTLWSAYTLELSGNCNAMWSYADTSAALKAYCGYYMFYRNSFITSASGLLLPSMTLSEGCYQYMFCECYSLPSAPDLEASILETKCYNRMFSGCSSLNHIKMLATDISASSCLTSWVNGVASTGLFIKSPSMTSLPFGANGIPIGWGVQDDGSPTVVYDFSYKNSAYNVTLPAGTYKLECWGAQGGHFGSNKRGGKGGYSVGELTIANSTAIYVRTGGKGADAASGSASSGGFNGGGNAYVNGAGGGASDIRIGQDSLYARVIVAGGGGGAASYNTERYGGVGGGATGGAGQDGSTSYKGGTGGGQTARGTSYYGTTSDSTTYGTLANFGTGGGRKGTSTSYQVGGGGGGWYGGGYARYAGSGGGSGYVYTANTASNYPSGCLLNSDYYLDYSATYDGTTSNPSVDGNTETGHEGNGYVRITLIENV